MASQLEQFVKRQGGFCPVPCSFLKPFHPPWERFTINWKYFNVNEQIQGTLIFTDESKNNKVGGAFVVYNNGIESHSTQFRLSDHATWNEYTLNPLTRIHWRASLVPAAAVIPAPIAYIKVVAVKKLVVGSQLEPGGPPTGGRSGEWEET
ncbi:uncharacterized protein CEXT_318861 [Caerostris extrusa]|uniref:Uncharacterized protein n=1 Tax=Caerostris extrusa TaxID=172846 RepID=A0AAV4MFS3_CAEEX|nr:uncharacterized protein CEXT_318861 [Caerostris extrusa]